MKYNTQTDPKWKDEDMGAPGDKLGRWGCLVTCLANIIQEVRKKDFTPKDMNDLIKNIKAYHGLKFAGTKHWKRSVTSYLQWDDLIKYFSKSLIFKLRLPVSDYKKNKKCFYIAKITTSWGGHYINVIEKKDHYLTCFDVWDGKIKKYGFSKVKFLHEIKVKDK